MAVPWTGFPLAELIKRVEPTSEAKYIKMTTFVDRTVALNQLRFWYPWPYTEALTIEEGMNELTLLATGIYGKPMPKQHGAPIRLVVPWKYGFKNIKSIVAIEFVKERPKTLLGRVGQRIRFFGPMSIRIFPTALVSGRRAYARDDEKNGNPDFNGYETWVASMSGFENRLYFMYLRNYAVLCIVDTQGAKLLRQAVVRKRSVRLLLRLLGLLLRLLGRFIGSRQAITIKVKSQLLAIDSRESSPRYRFRSHPCASGTMGS